MKPVPQNVKTRDLARQESVECIREPHQPGPPNETARLISLQPVLHPLIVFGLRDCVADTPVCAQHNS